MSAKRAARGGTNQGVVPWYVPEGAEWDTDVQLDPERKRVRITIEGAPFERAWRPGTWESQVRIFEWGLDEERVHWDEVEDWDYQIPRRQTLVPHVGEFEDLTDLIGVDFEPDDKEMSVLARDALIEREAELRRQSRERENERKRKRQAKRARDRQRKADERVAARKSGRPVTTAMATMRLRDLFG